MIKLGKRCTINFFNRFKMHLSQELNTDIKADFSCKWSVIEQSLFKAMSKEQNTLRLANFYNTDYTQFHSMPLELIINSVDKSVDTTLGKSLTVHKDAKDRTLSNYLYSYLLFIYQQPIMTFKGKNVTKDYLFVDKTKRSIN